ncbi:MULTISPECIES: PTS fructose transporter subunit IIA [unclassified Breznakia]|uniref:PTS sugar transporter subunit IIA n=1 Tax=unclassified Breznakia TaxID=2623764 RepID=UPI0024758B4E|nr:MULTISPECIES: PTS fructose transporter subunit IIA [unclassified Breznakia]MDH6367949.1 fructoselysine and glucoselysine-specific PTS system IIA component [Breznakia sp. PH1-1]MDH6405037.1 fructoselysine and glucoselysine-specific PTS system IIA component [Breznakia sp. PF1-11]MDH6412752.1 fructoselysine and glucoselysine-specific PTS system IIA component [Breznakia sp. PFB1-11]MDH6415111.1 fructoselysine and glucoselysine-specific PTS system IIA component [Breznakia sp. PFB1-14]MDH6417423.
MRHYIIASHGTFAKGIYESIKIIIGEQENVTIINGYVEDTNIEKQVKDAFDSISDDAEIIALTDVFGGSVNNEFMKCVGKENYYLVTGMNLPLLMQIFLADPSVDIATTLDQITSSVDTAPKFCNKLFEDVNDDDEF